MRSLMVDINFIVMCLSLLVFGFTVYEAFNGRIHKDLAIGSILTFIYSLANLIAFSL